MKLVIVESPSKTKTIQKYLGPDYKVMASVGHICDLPKNSLGIDINNNFEPQYVITDSQKNKIINELKSAVKKSEFVYLATDPDREGEAISWHIANALDLKNQKNRIEFNEITYKAVHNAISSPREINMDLVDAQQARRVIDRLVGYKISPVLSSKIKTGLSGGRVQSSALKMLVDREREISIFKPQEYWNITAVHTLDNGKEIKSILSDKNGKKFKIQNKEQADEILLELNNSKWVVDSVKKSKTVSRPQAPFTTSTMQQDASQKLGISAPMVMQIAQSLYEGVEIPGEGHTALVSYIRTDSVRISSDMQKSAKDFIETNYGFDFVPSKPNYYSTKAKNAQDAHEAIRPISLERTPESLKGLIPQNKYKLYKLIYERFLASQMSEAIYDTTTVNISAITEKGDNFIFKLFGKTLEKKGYTVVYDIFKTEDEEDIATSDLPLLEERKILRLNKLLSEQKFTKPLPRYSEASLIKSMEENGIGRPSTYASVMSVLIKRAYVSKEKKALVPTILGTRVTEYLEQFFPSIVDLKFTATMEESLDTVENGANWKGILKDFYPAFAKDIEHAQKSSSKIQMPVEESDVQCEKCGAMMVVKEGKYGKFLACPNYPKCKNIKNIVESVGKCPSCGGEIIVRHTKAGKIFYGCNNYPECKFMSWDLPAPFLCPDCESIMKVVKSGGITQYVCTNRKCNKTVDANFGEDED
jgi:DNA topoisomerase-1